ncbi:MAG: histidine phosphatase family protein [Dehalococcoidia bacterium]|nr:histidine phosphatase family protein [Dehalococcoidia bacterium]
MAELTNDDAFETGDLDRLFQDDPAVGELLLIRPGQPTVRDPATARSSDTGLSAVGVEQVEKLARRLSTITIAAIYSGPESVSRETAGRLSVALSCPVRELPALRGLTDPLQGPEAAASASSELLSGGSRRNDSSQRLEAEAEWRAFPGRVIATLERLMAHHPQERIVGGARKRCQRLHRFAVVHPAQSIRIGLCIRLHCALLRGSQCRELLQRHQPLER